MLKMHKQQSAIASLSLLIFFTSSNLVAGQVFRTGSCPNVTTVDPFDASAYLGTWYEYAKYNFIFEAGGRCIKAEYGDIGNNQVSVVNTQINVFNSPQSLEGTAKIAGPGKLLVRFSGFASLAGDAPYWVLGTDYKNYAVVFSCVDLLLSHAEIVWILTRERVPSGDIIKLARDIIKVNHLSLNDLHITNQANC